MSKKTYKNFKGGLTIIKEYSDLIPPLSESALDLLTENIKRDGVIREPLTVDQNNVLLDGHNRYRIAEKLDMDFKTIVQQTDSIESGVLWMIGNQLGRRELTKAQLAILSIAYKPYYDKLCKERQSMGGKTKTGLGKGLKTSQLLSKKFKINETLIKDITRINKENPEIVPLLKANYMEITMHEADILCKARKSKEITDIVLEGLMTKEAKDYLNEVRNPTETLAEKAARIAQENADALKQKAIEDKKKQNELKVLNKKKASDKLARESSEGTPPGGDNLDNPNDDGTSGSIQTPKIEESKEIEAIKVQEYLNDLRKEISKDKVFSDKVELIDSLLISETAQKFALEYKNKKTNKNYYPNIIMAVSNKKLDNKIKLATSISSYFCDSSDYQIRFLYFGTERKSFYNVFTKCGLIMFVVREAPENIKMPKGKKPAKVKKVSA